MSKKLSTKDFIERARLIHGDRYDYQKVEYINNRTKVEIICFDHGVFKQIPNSHLNKRGCPECGGKLKITLKEFIEKANIIHKNKYNYDKVNYINSNAKVEIICEIHGSFMQTPDSHINNKSGCPKCNGKFKSTKEEFIKKANLIHNNKYFYENIKYINNKTKIEIICKEHGIFTQIPNSHLNKSGCPLCYGKFKSTKEEFIKKANKIHNNKYNYDKVNYINDGEKIEIICKNHGSFFQIASNHLRNHGCPSCSHYISRPEIQWLDYLKIPKEFRQINFKINNRLIKTDAFDKENKIVYEFFGDYWHGNPKRYNFNEINKVCKKTFGELYNKTIEKINFLKQNKYQVIYIWESDWNNICNL